MWKFGAVSRENKASRGEMGVAHLPPCLLGWENEPRWVVRGETLRCAVGSHKTRAKGGLVLLCWNDAGRT